MNMMCAAASHNPVGDWKAVSLEVAGVLSNPIASGIFSEIWEVEFTIPEHWTDDNQAHRKEIINHKLLVTCVDWYDEATNWFDVVIENYTGRVQHHIWMWGAVNGEQNTMNDELLIPQNQLHQKLPTRVARHAVCDRLMLHVTCLSVYIRLYWG